MMKVREGITRKGDYCYYCLIQEGLGFKILSFNEFLII
jgi:hypothetical protein